MTSTGKWFGKMTRESKSSFFLSSSGMNNFDEAIRLTGYAKKGILERFIESISNTARAVLKRK